ncbi:MAG: T9SS type A sorting domain-containing protein [Bacteroidia bacterium]|nr:T9SS type A sorting domain-containing protein [Bacteroidia bacterium]
MKSYLILILLTIPVFANAQLKVKNGFEGMVQVGSIYVDKYEAPNIEGESPFVMFNYIEANNWCQARGKRLLSDSEWETVAGGPLAFPYVYGSTYNSLACNDTKTWIMPDQSLINMWPSVPDLNNINTFSELIDSVQNISSDAALSANHILYLYQADPSGSDTNCVGYNNVYDMNGNVLEWTQRSDGGIINFHGNLKGGYWSQSSTIQTSTTAHSDNFRYYNTGFRCAKDLITSVQSVNNNEKSAIYPNPASHYLDIRCHGQFPIIVIISSVYGQDILSANIKTEPARLDISGLVNGVYFIRITDKSGKSMEYKMLKY